MAVAYLAGGDARDYIRVVDVAEGEFAEVLVEPAVELQAAHPQ